MASSTRSPKRLSGRQRARRKGWRTAQGSDIHELYELSVQDPDNEVDIIRKFWTECRGGTINQIREDFCGTAAVARRWVQADAANTCTCIDLDREVLDWARGKSSEELTEEQHGRLTFIEGDVRMPHDDRWQCVLAHNFSYYLFKTRTELRDYFADVHASLRDDGLFILDAYGGSDSFLEMEEERDLDGFSYVWDQHSYNPITGDVVNYIHFVFPDGTRIDRAFTYEWRLWTIPEIRELLQEAGFSDVAVYWEGTDEETEEGNGEWTRSTQGEACEGWIAYVVGIR